MMIDFLKYCLWATIQHTFFIFQFYLYFYFSCTSPTVETTTIAILLFSFVAHNGNALLSVLCFVLAVVFYPIIFLTNYYIISALLLVIVHALSGIFLKIRGVDMRVWRFK